MIEDIVFDSLLLVFETPEETLGGTISSYSFDGDNFDASSGGEVSVIFFN